MLRYLVMHLPFRSAPPFWVGVLFSGWLGLQCLGAGAEELRFKRLMDESSGMASTIGATTGIIQDQWGFIWIAGENGILRYDGVTTKRYAHAPHAISLNSNYVRHLVLDHDGVLWAGTDLGLCWLDHKIDNFRCFVHDPGDPASLTGNTISALALHDDNRLFVGTNNGVNILNADRSRFTSLFDVLPNGDPHPLSQVSALLLDGDTLWIGTRDAGFSMYDLQMQTLRSFPYLEGKWRSVQFPHVRHFMIDHQQRLWIATYGGGVTRFDPAEDVFTHYRQNPQSNKSLASDVVWQVYQDSSNDIWVATDGGGLARYDERTDNFTVFRHNPYNLNSLSSDQIRMVYEDRHKNLWIGNFPAGISFLDRAAQVFTTWSYQPDNPNSLSESAILSLLEDSEGVIWIGTENGLNSYDPRTQKFQRYMPNLLDETSLQTRPILCLEEDPTGDIWAGTWSGGLYRLNKKTGAFRRYAADSEDSGVETNFVWKVLRDRSGQIWMGGEGGGLTLYDRQNDRFIPYMTADGSPASLSSDTIFNLLEDSGGNLWVGTEDGLDRINRKTGKVRRFQSRITASKSGNRKIKTVRFREIIEDPLGQIWIGSQNDGLFVYNKSTGHIRQIGMDQGLPGNSVYSMAVDTFHKVWIATTDGVAYMDPADLDNLQVITRKHGLAGNNHNRDATMVDTQGRVYLGSTKGVTIFSPEDLNFKPQSIPLLIKDFLVLNESMLPGQPGSPLKKTILDTSELTLNHSHSMITFEFVALNYQATAGTEYAYQMEGFDSDWRYVGSNRFATYTNLPQGEYIFKVKARVDGKNWLKNSPVIKLKISPPPWLTWWAYCLYGLALFTLVAFLVRIQYRKLELESEKALNAELIRLNTIKDAFLANTSHELRTPLNGIIGIAESVVEEASAVLSSSLRYKLQLIANSGKRLANLINDILDYTKLGKNKLQIFPKPVNLKCLTNDVFELLNPLADAKGIQLCNIIQDGLPLVYADENRLQQILLNLIGNAIKYTHKGSVFVSARRLHGHLDVEVADTGIGIPEDQQDSIFEAFQQLESSDARSNSGTGLGLAVTKELVELHGGQISVESKVHKGSRFRFTIPVCSDVSEPLHTPHVSTINPHRKRPAKIKTLQSPAIDGTSVGKIPIGEPPPNAAGYTIMIVDDDPINRMVLGSILQLHHYTIIEAADGLEALDFLNSRMVDIVILDIMMPKMSGFEVCREIRKRFPIDSMPVLFLTAKNVDGDIARGYALGGNEFLTKPISKYELLPRVANHIRLLATYRQLRQRF